MRCAVLTYGGLKRLYVGLTIEKIINESCDFDDGSLRSEKVGCCCVV